jgi:hypothetical protein
VVVPDAAPDLLLELWAIASAAAASAAAAIFAFESVLERVMLESIG